MGRESLLAHFHENETEYSVRMFLIWLSSLALRAFSSSFRLHSISCSLSIRSEKLFFRWR